jgi:hypothetical protein
MSSPLPLVHLRNGFRCKSCGPGRLADGRSLTGDWRLVTCEPCKATDRYRKAIAGEQERARLPLIGHDLVLIRNLARQLHRDGTHGHAVGPVSERGTGGRGFAFQVWIREPDGLPSGRIARVQITLDRVEQPQETAGGQ